MKRGRGFIFFSVLVIIAAGFIAYANSFDSRFIWDDYYLVRDNTFIRDWSQVTRIFTTDMGAGSGARYNFYRPLQIFTYLVDYSIWGLDPRGYHIGNTILHLSVALCVFWLGAVITRNHLISLSASALYVVHPIHTGTVSYISGRTDSLAALFMLLCFMLYLKSPDAKRPYFGILVVLSYLPALLSKEYTVILPGLILLYHLTFKKKINMTVFLPVAASALGYILLRMSVFRSFFPAPKMYPSTLAERVPGFLVALTGYLRLLLLPVTLHREYGNRLFPLSDPRAIFGLVVFLLLLFLAFLRRRKGDYQSAFFIYWFFLALFPVSNLYPANAYMREHWLYFPSIGLFLAAAGGLVGLLRKRRWRVAIAGALVVLPVFYAALTVRQNRYWKDGVALFRRSLELESDSPLLLNQLGLEYARQGRHREAISSFRRVIEIEPAYLSAYFSLGEAYRSTGDYEAAARWLEKAVEVNPGDWNAHNNLGIVYGEMGRHRESILTLQRTIELNPGYARAYNNLGYQYLNLGRAEEAVELFKRALEIDPEVFEAYYNLGLLYANDRRYPEALRMYLKASEIRPDFALVHYRLAEVYYQEEQYEQAVEHCDRAILLGAVIAPEFLKLLEAYRRDWPGADG